MIVSIIKCKSKDWKEHFKKEFGAYHQMLHYKMWLIMEFQCMVITLKLL